MEEIGIAERWDSFNLGRGIEQDGREGCECSRGNANASAARCLLIPLCWILTTLWFCWQWGVVLVEQEEHDLLFVFWRRPDFFLHQLPSETEIYAANCLNGSYDVINVLSSLLILDLLTRSLLWGFLQCHAQSNPFGSTEAVRPLDWLIPSVMLVWENLAF